MDEKLRIYLEWPNQLSNAYMVFPYSYLCRKTAPAKVAVLQLHVS